MLIVEKLPLLALSGASCVVTMMAQRGTISSGEQLPFIPRLANALLAYAKYLEQTVWPTGLTVLYPWPRAGMSMPAVLFSLLVLAGVSVAVVALRRRRPYLTIGWLWYLGMLVPVIGLMQVGLQSHADRYTYLPQIGLIIMVTWGVSDLSAGWPNRRRVCATAGVLVVALLASLAVLQTFTWRDSVSLWTRTLRLTSYNAYAHYSLGLALVQQGRNAEAFEQFLRARDLSPGAPEIYVNLGNVLGSQGKIDEAMDYYRHALSLDPRQPAVHVGLGDALASQGDFLGAAAAFRRALELDPGDVNALMRLGKALQFQGQYSDAVALYMRTLENAPEEILILKDLGRLLATCPDASVRNGPEAVRLASEANRLTGGQDPLVLDTLGAAHAEAGNFSAAIENARRARDIATAKGEFEIANEIRMRLQLYELGFPYRGTR